MSSPYQVSKFSILAPCRNAFVRVNLIDSVCLNSDERLYAGTKQVKYLEQNAQAYFVKLTKEEIQYLSDMFDPEKVRLFQSRLSGYCFI